MVVVHELVETNNEDTLLGIFYPTGLRERTILVRIIQRRLPLCALSTALSLGNPWRLSFVCADGPSDSS